MVSTSRNPTGLKPHGPLSHPEGMGDGVLSSAEKEGKKSVGLLRSVPVVACWVCAVRSLPPPHLWCGRWPSSPLLAFVQASSSIFRTLLGPCWPLGPQHFSPKKRHSRDRRDRGFWFWAMDPVFFLTPLQPIASCVCVANFLLLSTKTCLKIGLGFFLDILGIILKLSILMRQLFTKETSTFALF